MEKIFDKIKNLIDINQYHLFIKNKIVLSSVSLKELKNKLKDEYNNPPTDIKCFIVSFGLKSNYKFPLTINCSQYTITTKLILVMKDDDISQTFTYSENELTKYSFKLSHIKKIIRAIEKDLISFESNSVPITDIIK